MMKNKVEWKQMFKEIVATIGVLILIVSVFITGMLLTGNIDTVEYVTDTDVIYITDTVYRDTDTDTFGEAYLEAMLEEYIEIFDDADYFNQFDVDMINDYEFHRRLADVLLWYETLEDLDSDLYTDAELVRYADMLKLKVNSFAVYVAGMRDAMARPSYTQQEVENIIEEFIDFVIEVDEEADNYDVEYDYDTQIMYIYEVDEFGNRTLEEEYTMDELIEITK